MNIVVPPKIVALLRNGVALTIMIVVSIWLAPTYGFLYQIDFLIAEFACSPIIAMIATKERQSAFLFVTLCTWLNAIEIYSMWQHSIIFYNNSQQQFMEDTVLLWGQGIFLSFFGSLPISLWRKWRRQRQANTEAASQRLRVIEEIGTGTWPPSQ
ncbi:MAG: hypothetical protein ACRYFS_23835 [Janthinobacterium lividum]